MVKLNKVWTTAPAVVQDPITERLRKTEDIWDTHLLSFPVTSSFSEPISTYSPSFHHLLSELIPLRLPFLLVGGMVTLRKNLCWAPAPISLEQASFRRLKQYYPKTAGHSCTGNMLVLAEEEVEWPCLRALERMYCLQPQLSKPVNLCLPQEVLNSSPVWRFSEVFAEKLWRSKRETHPEFAVEDQQAHLLNDYLTSK